MTFNPYQPPAQPAADAVLPGTQRLYRVINYLYAAIILACTLILVIGRPPPLDIWSLWAALYFHAPIFCFALLRWGNRAHSAKVVAAYGVYVGLLFGILIWRLLFAGPLPGIGLIIVGNNAFWLAAAHLQLRSR